MLSTLLQNVQSFVGKAFLVAFFVPALVFAFCNVAALYGMSAGFRSWADALLDAGSAWRRTLASAVAVVATALLGFVLSSINGWLRGVLEGRWPAWLVALFRPTQAVRLGALEDERDRAIAARHGLAEAGPRYARELKAERAKGVALKGVAANATDLERVKDGIDALVRRARAGELLTASDVDPIAKDLATQLAAYDADQDASLDLAQLRFDRLLTDGLERATQRLVRVMNEIQFNFGLQDLAPTSMGNVANTVQSYAVSRYGLNFERLWSGLQRIAQRDEKAYATIQDSKTQLDFLVSSCGLTFVWSSVWTLATLRYGTDWRVFLAAALGGPVATYLWYRIAVEQYRAFADVLRTTVDGFRFKLLEDLRFGLPVDLSQERDLWNELNKTLAYAEPVNLRLQHPKAT